MEILSKKLKFLKDEVIKWEKARWSRARKELVSIEAQIDSLNNGNFSCIYQPKELEMLVNLGQEKLNILKLYVEKWRLKCWVTWLKAGDKNTKFFHNYAEDYCNSNSILEFKSGHGVNILEHEDLQ